MFISILIALFCLPFVILRFLRCRVSIFEVFFLFLLITLLSSITQLPDLDNYQYSYRHLLSSGEQGFFALERFFSSLNFSFYEFYMVCHVACLMIVYLSIKLASLDGLKCLALYAFYPFLLDVIQIRNAMFMALALLAFVICSRCKNRIIECLVWVSFIALACSMHFAAYAYVPAVFFWCYKHRFEKIPLVMFFVTSFLILIDGSSLAQIMQNVFSFLETDNSKYDGYMEKRSSLGGFLMMFESCLMIYVVWFARRKISDLNLVFYDYAESKISVMKFVDNAYGFLLYSSIFWPLYVISSTFCRLMQNQLVIVYVVFFMFVKSCMSFENSYDRMLKKDALLKMIFPFVMLILVHSEWLWVEFWDYIIVCLIENLKLFYVFKS